mmetsp:Transcript_603/g.1606  ORF Transcript_603/g.1606 Transcript_603/m.1606 type:complete len:371 (-) Transcript_603:733-1845(-)
MAATKFLSVNGRLVTSWGQTLGVSWEHGGLSDVIQAAEEHNNSLKTDSCTSVGIATAFESVQVALDLFGGDAVLDRPGCEQNGVVHPLRSADDFLAANEYIKGSGIVLVLRVGHGVKRPDAEGELVKDVKVGAILVLHQFAQRPLHLRAQIIQRRHIVPGVLEQPDALGEGDPQRLGEVLQRLHWVLLGDHGELLCEAALQPLEHVDEQMVEHVKHLLVRFVDRHLHIQAYELSQVAVSVRVFGPENRSDLENTCHIATNGHLLVKLRALCQARGPTHVIHVEHRCTSLGCPRQELGRVDFHKVVGEQGLPEKLAHCRLNPEDSIVGRSPQIDHAVVQPRVLSDPCQFLSPGHRIIDLLLAPRGIRQVER